MNPKLAILIPTLQSRDKLLNRVCAELRKQIEGNATQVTILMYVDQGQKTTGFKRNSLIQSAFKIGAEYIAFVDDDDMIGETYIQRGLEVANSGMDVGELWGQIYWSGKPGKPFHHSIIHSEWYEDKKYYYRQPNHLNFIKLALIKDIEFPDQVFGEDAIWSYRVRDAGVLKNEYKINEVTYHYYCGKK